MKALKGNTFLYFVDKNVSKVNGIWKALHISIYIAIAVNAFITSMATGNMFQTFKYNCILFCTDIAFQKEIVPTESFLAHSQTARDISLESAEMMENNINITIASMENQNYTENDYGNATASLSNSTDLQANLTSLNKASVNSNMIKKENGTILFQNQSHIFLNEGDSIAIIYAKIDVRKSIFPSNFLCNFVLGTALITFIFATFCTVILAMCSKGGKGRNNTLNRPQNMIYPILVSSIILGVLNVVSSVSVTNGMAGFCASFELFTGEKSCSPLINKFTLHERQGNFYLPYMVLSHAFNISVILFVGQVAVTLLRVIYAVDYQLYAMEVDENEEEHEFEVEDGHVVKERTL